MVKRLIVNLVLEYGAKVTKSVANAYRRVVSGEGGAKSEFGKFADKTFGRMMTTPLTRDESIKILGIESKVTNIKDDIDPQAIMERFEELFSRNDPEKGGSFYLQSKIYFAKEFLMQDHPVELNISKFNPTEDAGDEKEEEVPEENKAEGKEESKDKDNKKQE